MNNIPVIETSHITDAINSIGDVGASIGSAIGEAVHSVISQAEQAAANAHLAQNVADAAKETQEIVGDKVNEFAHQANDLITAAKEGLDKLLDNAIEAGKEMGHDISGALGSTYSNASHAIGDLEVQVKGFAKYLHDVASAPHAPAILDPHGANTLTKELIGAIANNPATVTDHLVPAINAINN
ncbi:hypothetical protein NEOKW01_0365 [Nematocida sp. AWRm80]|nr:hypothetical protein NEOKW01_0365 [Nematocida sp. AWRm80]